jgi:hypothetical protein
MDGTMQQKNNQLEEAEEQEIPLEEAEQRIHEINVK